MFLAERKSPPSQQSVELVLEELEKTLRDLLEEIYISFTSTKYSLRVDLTKNNILPQNIFHIQGVIS